MSDNIMKLIPISPEYVPEANAIGKAIDLLKIYFAKADEITFVLTDNIRFIDPGSNLENIYCPYCGKKLDITWWQEAMNNASRSNFQRLVVVTPCCNVTTSLNELRYEWNAGFARFSLEIRNPINDIDDNQFKSIEVIINSRLKKILAHY